MLDQTLGKVRRLEANKDVLVGAPIRKDVLDEYLRLLMAGSHDGALAQAGASGCSTSATSRVVRHQRQEQGRLCSRALVDSSEGYSVCTREANGGKGRAGVVGGGVG